MSKQNEKPVLVAEINVAEAEHLARELARFYRQARLATSTEQILEVLRSEILHEAIVAVELDIDHKPVLAHLAGLPSFDFIVAVGPANEAEMEIRARVAGAQVYLPRPVTSQMLSGLSWIRNNRDRLCSSSADRSRYWLALASARSAGLDPASVREIGGRHLFSKEMNDKGQTSSFSPFSLPGL